MRTHINWCDDVWNPVTGCTRVSSGCDHCYIERQTPFRVQHRRFDKDGIGGTTGVTLHPERLDKVTPRQKPRRIFVNSMSDLFHDAVPDGYIGSVWNAMALCPQHTFLVLTKRPARARSLLRRWEVDGWMWRRDDMLWCGPPKPPAPLPNVHLGVTVENQWAANTRIPILLDTPAAIRWLSCEPLIEPTTIGPADGIDWVVIGGETGPGARPMSLTWAEHVAGQAHQAGAAVWTKQLGTVLAHDLGAPKKGDQWDDLPAQVQYRELPARAGAPS